MPYLQIENLSKHFSGVHALKNVSFSVEKGEVHAICGENGAGKSTLIKILGGIYPSNTHEGEIKLNNEDKIKQYEECKKKIRDGIKGMIEMVEQEKEEKISPSTTNSSASEDPTYRDPIDLICLTDITSTTFQVFSEQVNKN